MYTLTKEEWLSQYEGKLSERDIKLMSCAHDVIAGNTLNKENMPWGDIPAVSPWLGCPGLWNWDTVFHGMTISRYDSVLAQNSVDCYAKFQCENGMLPEVEDPRRNEFLEELVAAGIENSPLPECRPEYWNALNNWLSSLLDCNGFKR